MQINRILRLEDSQSHVAKSHLASIMGQGDPIDVTENFKLSCPNQRDGTPLVGGSIFTLRGEFTKSFISASHSYNFNHNNCGRGCPIMGQLEVFGLKHEAESNKWKVHFGLFSDHEGREPDTQKWIYEADEKLPEKPKYAQRGYGDDDL